MITLGIIPARMAATRFPNKPLAKIDGMPMIGHVYNRAKKCKNLDSIYVATCDEEIYDYIVSIGGNCVYTKDTHKRASERTNEAFQKIIQKESFSVSGVLMIQGDEPVLNPKLLDDLIVYHRSQKQQFVTNLISEIKEKKEFEDLNIVKVVTNLKNEILYMSRSPIPSNPNFNNKLSMWKQLGLIIFSKEALLTYGNLDPTPLEQIESVDMNRFIEHGFKISTFSTNEISQAVDTKKDIEIVEKILLKDKLVSSYIK